MLSKLKYPALTFLISFAVLFFFYHEVILSPNSYLFAPSGDGIKNYYTFLYHATYDTSFWEFSGMNYPFGEHIVYTDSHPLLSWIIRSFGLVDYGIGILNLLMILSFPICSMILYRIFRLYKVERLWSVLAAVTIAFLSPQIFRLTGHLSLSYVFAIPLMWYFLILAHRSNRSWMWSGIIAAYLLIFFFTHPYLGIIMAFLAVFFWLIRIITERKNRGRIFKIAGMLGLQILIPFLLFQISVSLTDTHLDRTNDPAGFYKHAADWKSVLAPHSGPINDLAEVAGYELTDWERWESWAYIGFSTIVFGLVCLVFFIRRRKEISLKKLLGMELFSFAIAAYLILLWSFCFPLKYEFLHWVVDLFGPLKQFRVLGRFDWVFFYVFVVFVIIILYRVKEKSSKPGLVSALFFAGLIFTFFETYPVHNRISGKIASTKNEFKRVNLSSDFNETIDFVQKEEYDALIFLPFSHYSSEHIMIVGTEQSAHDALLLGFHTNTPLVNSISSRMSRKEARMVNNFFGPEFVDKEFAAVLGYDKKIGIVKNTEGLNPDELRMIWTSKEVFSNEEFKVFDFDMKAWNNQEEIKKVFAAADSVGADFDDWTNWTEVIVESFDSERSRPDYPGSSGLKGVKNGINIVYTMESRHMIPGNYVCSYWYSLKEDRPDITAFVEISMKDGESSWESPCKIFESKHIVQDWCLVEHHFEIRPETETINFLLTGNGNGQPFEVDELLIRKEGAHHYRRQMFNRIEYLVYNNYYLEASFPE